MNRRRKNIDKEFTLAEIDEAFQGSITGTISASRIDPLANPLKERRRIEFFDEYPIISGRGLKSDICKVRLRDRDAGLLSAATIELSNGLPLLDIQIQKKNIPYREFCRNLRFESRIKLKKAAEKVAKKSGYNIESWRKYVRSFL